MKLFLQNLLLIIGLSVTVLQVAEFMANRISLDPSLRAACKVGAKIDERDRRDAVVDLRRVNENWFPAVPANAYLENRLLTADSARIVPLGGVANAEVVGCNDSGYFSTFPTDEFGFNNPHEAWHEGPRKKVFFVGDSFTQGDCRRQGESIVDRLRAAVPGVINLGSGGNGPLLELAGIREYVADGAVAKVVWMYTEGTDLEDLKRDVRNEVLTNYLDPKFSQQLRARRDEVNGIVRRYVEKLISDYIDNRPRFIPTLRTAVWQALHHGMSQVHQAAGPVADESYDIALFGRVLALAKAEVEGKGGQLVFVYLPEYNRFSGQMPSEPARYREQVLSLVHQLKIRVVDVDPIIKNASDPLALYPYRLKGHFNPEGTALVAVVIERVIH